MGANDFEVVRLIIEVVIGVLVTPFALVLWWNFRKLDTRGDLLAAQIAALNLKLAEGYVPRAELENTFSRLFALLEEMRKEIAHISRNQAQVRVLSSHHSQ